MYAIYLFSFFFEGFFVFLAMAVYTGVTVNYYGKRYGNWRFSWSYIIGWVAMVLTFFSGTQAQTTNSGTLCSTLFIIVVQCVLLDTII